jgi:hypothetical protein
MNKPYDIRPSIIMLLPPWNMGHLVLTATEGHFQNGALTDGAEAKTFGNSAF